MAEQPRPQTSERGRDMIIRAHLAHGFAESLHSDSIINRPKSDLPGNEGIKKPTWDNPTTTRLLPDKTMRSRGFRSDDYLDSTVRHWCKGLIRMEIDGAPGQQSS